MLLYSIRDASKLLGITKPGVWKRLEKHKIGKEQLVLKGNSWQIPESVFKVISEVDINKPKYENQNKLSLNINTHSNDINQKETDISTNADNQKVSGNIENRELISYLKEQLEIANKKLDNAINENKMLTNQLGIVKGYYNATYTKLKDLETDERLMVDDNNRHHTIRKKLNKNRLILIDTKLLPTPKTDD